MTCAGTSCHQGRRPCTDGCLVQTSGGGTVSDGTLQEWVDHAGERDFEQSPLAGCLIAIACVLVGLSVSALGYAVAMLVKRVLS